MTFQWQLIKVADFAGMFVNIAVQKVDLCGSIDPWKSVIIIRHILHTVHCARCFTIEKLFEQVSFDKSDRYDQCGSNADGSVFVRFCCRRAVQAKVWLNGRVLSRTEEWLADGTCIWLNEYLDG